MIGLFSFIVKKIYQFSEIVDNIKSMLYLTKYSIFLFHKGKMWTSVIATHERTPYVSLVIISLSIAK